MRTTIRIDDGLYRRAKTRAAETGRTVSEVIEEAVRELLRPRSAARGVIPPLVTYGGTGVQPGVELSDNAALADLMDAGAPLDALR